MICAMLSYLILSYLILSYLILSYLILSYLILSYLILSILSYLILSCTVGRRRQRAGDDDSEGNRGPARGRNKVTLIT
jgi:membrane protein implicated in regulation of membrane protease activity